MEPATYAPRAYIPFHPAVKSSQPHYNHLVLIDKGGFLQNYKKQMRDTNKSRNLFNNSRIPTKNIYLCKKSKKSPF